MEYKKGADVISNDGEKIGTLDRVVLDPKTKEVAYLVVKSGFLLTEDKLISIDQVKTVAEKSNPCDGNQRGVGQASKF